MLCTVYTLTHIYFHFNYLSCLILGGKVYTLLHFFNSSLWEKKHLILYSISVEALHVLISMWIGCLLCLLFVISGLQSLKIKWVCFSIVDCVWCTRVSKYSFRQLELHETLKAPQNRQLLGSLNNMYLNMQSFMLFGFFFYKIKTV